jgi:uncharacterized OB-fold protein
MAGTDAALRAFQPVPDGLTEPFWRGAAEGRLVLSRCPRCRRWQHPPLTACRVCGVTLHPEVAPMAGVIYSYTTMYHSSVPLYDPPYVVAVVEVGAIEGPRIVVRVVDCDPDQVDVGAPVTIEMRDLPGGTYKVPVAVLTQSAIEVISP